MKCDDFLPTLAAGGMVGRAMARWHAGRCERCAAARVNFLAARRQWAEPAALSAADRDAWLQGANGERLHGRAKVPRVAKWGLAAAGLATAAAAIFVTVVVLRSNHRTAAMVRVTSGSSVAARNAPAIEATSFPSQHAAEFPSLHGQESPAEPSAVQRVLKQHVSNSEPTFDALERGLDELAGELDALKTQAALIDARREVDHLLATYQPLGVAQAAQADTN